MPTVLVHVRANAAGAIRREKRNGREVIIVPSATLPDDVVMNDVLYPADEIAKSFKQLERKPAPLGHPTINGKFVSASDPEGLNLGWIGAWNENVRQEKGKGGRKRVLLDKVIDVERANQSEGGKRVLDAIEKGEAIHTSNALYAEFEAANGDVAHKFIARNMEWDHDAILLDQPGAATPDQGVGMLVNSAGQAEEIQVINSALSDMTEQQLDWAVDSLARALEQQARLPLLERIRSAAIKAFGLSERDISSNQKEDDVTDKAQFDALSAKVDALSEAMKPEAMAQAIANAVGAALKPLNDQLAANAAEQKAKDDAERATLTDKLIAANLLDDASEGAAIPLASLRTLAGNIKADGAAPLNAKFSGNTNDKPVYQVPAAAKGA